VSETVNVLIVEDDATVRELLALHLKRAGFRTLEAGTAEDAWDRLNQTDLVVLDRMLPGESGDDLLKRLRMHPTKGDLPVLMLTARASEVDRVSGLEGGADDYMVKPFSAPELVARLRALLRRAPSKRKMTVGPLTVDVEEATAELHGSQVPLTRREFELLAFLATHPGRVFSRTELLDRVWGESFLGTERTVDQHVAQLRQRIGEGLIDTVRGRGYRLVEPGGSDD
jgi:DNA-binding response OmpR family regulator